MTNKPLYILVFLLLFLVVSSYAVGEQENDFSSSSTITTRKTSLAVLAAVVENHEGRNNAEQDSSLSFLVMSDAHHFTPFSFGRNSRIWENSVNVLSHIKEQYGGELVLMPGDTVSYGGQSNDDIRERLNAPIEMSMNEVVYTAGYNCYTTIREVYSAVGFDIVLAAVGDHELGGNEGFFPGNHPMNKISTISSYRKAVADGFNKDAQFNFLYSEKIGAAESRPLGTVFEETSYAYRYKNSLFITIDAFKTAINNDTNYMDRENGFGGEGTVTCDIEGPHLDWFKSVLIEARKDASIKHIFVQAHLPILQPVRKVNTSAQFIDGADKSEFWKVMNQYGVDVYFAGDVHSSTASVARDPNSSVVQIISRGNPFNNFLHVSANDTVIDVRLFNEVGPKRKYNTNYTEYGRLIIDKINHPQINIESMGGLEVVDPDSEMIRFDFEEIVPLGTRQVFALSDKENIMVNSMIIDGVECRKSMLNTGSLGAQYDAQVANIRIGAPPRNRQGGGLAAHFRKNSRFAIYGMGPYSAGEIVSFSMWFRPVANAARNSEMVLFHYGNFGLGSGSGVKERLTLTIAKGVPVLYFKPDVQFEAVGVNVLDRQWHQIAVSMPSKSCLASEFEVFIDGTRVETVSRTGNDIHVFFLPVGRISIGGLGYNSNISPVYPFMEPYRGWIDDFRLVSKPIQQ